MSEFGLEPIGDQIIVYPTQMDDHTAGGIFIPDESKPRPETGRVVAVGPGVVNGQGIRIRPNVNVGDKIQFDVDAGTDVPHEGKTYTIMPMRDVFGVLEVVV